MMSHHFQYCSQDSIQSYSSQASTVSSDENERQETCRVDVAKRQKCNDNASSSLVIIDNSQDVSHVMKHGKKMIGEIHDKRNEMILDAILREAARDGFQTSLSFPNRSKWLKAKVPIWFGTGGLLGR